MTENDFLDQIRFRIETAERRFRDDARALHGSQAAQGMLRSGATITKTLRLLEEQFSKISDEIIAYLAKTVDRTKLDRAKLLTITSQLLTQSKLVFESIADKGKLLSFAPGKRIEVVIDEAFARVGTRLTLRLQEFGFGLDETSSVLVSGPTQVAGGTMNGREFRERVLIALYRRAMRDGVQRYYDPNEVCQAAGLSWRLGQLRTVMVSLDENGLVKLSQTIGGGDDGGMDFRVTQTGIEEAEDLIEQKVQYQGNDPAPAEFIPASNRYVTLSDNQKDLISAQVQELKETLRGDNEIDDESRQIALSEIAVFEATIAAPRVATELVARFISAVLKGLVVALATAIVAVAAERLIGTLASIF